jgi:hypothetical protein
MGFKKLQETGYELAKSMAPKALLHAVSDENAIIMQHSCLSGFFTWIDFLNDNNENVMTFIKFW